MGIESSKNNKKKKKKLYFYFKNNLETVAIHILKVSCD